MTRILQATSRGQVTLPKAWRDQFKTNYFVVFIKNDELVLKPMLMGSTFKDEVESAWQEYKEGNVLSSEELMKKYGL